MLYCESPSHVQQDFHQTGYELDAACVTEGTLNHTSGGWDNGVGHVTTLIPVEEEDMVQRNLRNLHDDGRNGVVYNGTNNRVCVLHSASI